MYLNIVLIEKYMLIVLIKINNIEESPQVIRQKNSTDLSRSCRYELSISAIFNFSEYI